ncbi:hypothetical protein BGW80DRAFT_1272653 [Lactifluus volemus]|nr:hypothetical protein BGW80DRAFT_1272653 [Lactifluus volemus]
MINFWPYLGHEIKRFLLTRLWFALSNGVECGRDIRSNWFHDIISDVVEIVEATCEVLGLAGGTCDDEHLRSDWASYIEERKKNPESRSPLCEAMRWADRAEYQQGISRHWLRRTEEMGVHGSVLRTIAERYTLACVVGNSLSGSWMTAPQMAQEFAGLAQHRTFPAPRKLQRLTYFCRRKHHHVESVHLTTSHGRPLHPALAAVQTLRENSRQEGVSVEELKAYIQGL